jgi:hypothetical protein
MSELPIRARKNLLTALLTLRRLAQLSIVGLLYTIGLLLSSNFGVAWDEYQQRAIGTYNLIQIIRYINPGLVPSRFSYFPVLDNLKDGGYQTHGAWFEMLLGIFERILGLESDKSIFMMRHGLTFTFVFFGIVNLAIFLKGLTKSIWATLVSVLILITSPRLFADSFYNSKDMIFFSMICIGLNITRIYLKYQNRRFLVLQAVVIGLTAGVRLAGIILIVILTIMVIIKPPLPVINIIQRIRAGFGFILISGVTLIVSMPYLWKNPFVRLLDIATRNTQFEWNGNVLFNGSLISAKHLPWTYLPIWICITTPLLYLLCAFFGFALSTIFVIQRYRERKFTFESEHISLLAYLVFGLLCFIVVIIQKSVLYDGWRHFYFIYPLLICLSSICLKWLFVKFHERAIFKIFVILVFAQIILVSSWMVRNFPMTNLYFSPIISGQPALKWEMDYWGLGNLEALKWILEYDSKQTVTVSAISSTPLVQSLKLLQSNEISRLDLRREIKSPEYLINNFRGLRKPEISMEIDGYRLVKTFAVDKTVYLQIYKINRS